MIGMDTVVKIKNYRRKSIKKPDIFLIDMIFDPIKRKAVYKYYDSKYKENEEEERIFKLMRRKEGRDEE
jgi:hypothetical protein